MTHRPAAALPNGEKTKSFGWGGFPEGETWQPPEVVPSPHTLAYFDRIKSLPMLTNRVAVKRVESTPGQSLSTRKMAEGGFREDDLVSHPIHGWALATTEHLPIPVGNDDPVVRIGNLVRDLAAGDNEIEFVSPVFLDPDAGGRLIVTPVLLVGFANGITTERRREALESVAAVARAVRPEVMDPASSYLKIPLPGMRDAFSVLDAARALASHPDVLFAEPDMIFEGAGALVPNDPLFSSLWGLRNTGQSGGQVDFDMDADEAWDITTGSSSVKVLIIDTGVQQDHPDINQLPGRDFTSESASNPFGGPVNQWDRHGTPVAGAVSASMNNGIDTVGIAPGVKSVSARCFISSNSSGSWTGNYSWTADALNWAAAEGVRVTNNSNGYGGTSAAVALAYENTKAGGMVHFASAGNDAVSNLGYPANLDTVNGVAASNRFGSRASFSQWGTGLAFTAPGESILLPDRTGAAGYSAGNTSSMNGTSFSSPYTAGVAALIVSVKPEVTPSEIETVMRQTCVDMGTAGYDTNYGWGHVNAGAAVAATASSLDDAYEPNNSRFSSYNLSAYPEQWLDSIAGPGRHRDDDWFGISVPAGERRVKVDCLFTHIAGNLELALVNTDGSVVATSASSTNNESIDVVVPISGTYFVRVYGMENSGSTYNLRWETMPPPFLNLSATQETLTPAGGNRSFAVSSNADWTWTRPAGATWLSSSEPSSQSGTQTFSYFVPINTTVHPRNVDLTFTNGLQTRVFSIVQEGVPPVLEIDSLSRNLDHGGGTRNFNVSSNTDWNWSLGSSAPWLIITELPAQTGNQTFTYNVTPNPVDTPREVVIHLTNGTQSRTHTIVQKGVPPGVPSGFAVNSDSDDAIELEWNDSAFATVYEVWRGDNLSFSSMELIATTGDTFFADAEAETGEIAYYRIVARNENGASSASAHGNGKRFGLVDLMVSPPKGGGFYGSDSFHPVPAVAEYRIRRAAKSTFLMKIENESVMGSETINYFAGPGNSRFQVTYLSPAFGNVTAQLVAGSFTNRVFAGAGDLISATVKPTKKGAKRRGTIAMGATARFQAAPGRFDAVTMVLRKVK